jgi:hypothetical protein
MMYKGKHEGAHSAAKAQPVRGAKSHMGKLTALVITTALILTAAIGGTIAWLTAKDTPVKNTFNPSTVACEVTENFNGTVKSNVNVKNTGDTEAYIRVKLVTYRTNDDGQHIGGTAEIPAFTLGENWVQYGDYYYYTLPVEAGKAPKANLADSMTLTASYTDADGGHQSIDVMAEAIQSGPVQAVGQAWGVSISQGSVTAYAG